MSADRKFISLSPVVRKLSAFLGGRGRCVLAWIGKGLLVIVALFAIILLVTRYVILPEVGRYKGEIEKIASHALGNEVTIAQLDASWRGLNPKLDLTNLVIHAPNGEAALTLPNVQATLSWRSLLVASLRFKNLTIVSPDLSIERHADGKVYVAGLLAQSDNDSSSSADWVLAQHEIVVRDGHIRWRDDLRGAPELALSNVEFVLRNQWRHHRVLFTATPPASLAAPLDIRADFAHPALTRQISDISRWKGTLYVDVKDTSLAAWNAYIDYPLPLTSGTGSVRAWLDLNSAKAENVTADLNLSNLSVSLGPQLAPLALKTVKGRISAQETGGVNTEEGVPTFGTSGHRVELKDFSLETADGLTLASASVVESFEAATIRHPEKVSVKASDLDLKTLSSLAERLPLSPSQRQLLADFSPSGRLRDFTVEWTGSYPDIVSYRLHGAFNGLTVKPQPFRPAQKATTTQSAIVARPAMPGAENVSGYIDTTEKAGKLMLASTNTSLQWPDFFEEAILPFDQLDLNAHWALQNNDTLLFNLDDMQFTVHGTKARISGTHLLPLSAHSLGTVDMKGSVSSFDLKTIGRYLPANTEPKLKHWLSGALMDGTVEDVNVAVKGNLEDFPFNAPAKQAGKQDATDSHFLIAGKFKGLVMNYDPGEHAPDGVSPEWPLLEKARGTINIDRTRLEIHADTAQTNGVPVTNVRATIADLLSKDPVLEIDGNAAGPMDKMLGYVQKSPVSGWIEHFTKDTKATGNGKLHLAFQMPIEHPFETTAQGVVQLDRNDIDLIEDLPTISGASGSVAFNEKGFTLNNIKGRFLGGPVDVAGGSQSDDTIQIKAQGVVRIDGVREAFPQKELAQLLTYANGEAPYSVAIMVRHGLTDVTVDSSLRGVALTLPAPLQKTAAESLPTRFVLKDLASDDPLIKKDEMELTLGKMLSTRYVREKFAGAKASWVVTSGGLGINHPAPRPDTGVTAYVALDKLNLDDWSAFHTDIEQNQPEVRNPGLESGFAPYMPNALVIQTPELILSERKLHNVVFGASRDKSVWQANINADQVNGYVTWSEPRHRGDLGHVVARLTKLVIPQSAQALTGASLKTGDDKPVEIPELDIIVDDFQLFDKKLGRLELNASTESSRVGQEWRIKTLRLSNPDGTFKSAGSWIAAGSASTSNLTYALDIVDAGKLAERFGLHGALRGGTGKLDGAISWKGSPFSIDIPTLSGQMYLDVQKGQFLKIDPGGAKLLGVLSLQALPRRLVLDFRDVFSEGFAFDDIAGTANIDKGVVTTDTLKMRSVTADVLLKGSANIASETQNLHVTVIPDINLGTASVVAMTLNPVIGVGTFLTQLFLRGQIKESMTFDYGITGSWSDPIVTKLGKEKSASKDTQP